MKIKKRTVHVAVTQMEVQVGEIEKNQLVIEQMVQDIKRKHNQIDVIVFPEMCLYGYDHLGDSISIEFQGRLISALSKLQQVAIVNQVDFIIGYPAYQEKQDCYYNRIVYMDKRGSNIGEYDKMHLIPFEASIFTHGKRYVLLETSFAKIGLLVCWDLAFPEVSGLYAEHGADLLIAPSAWESPFQLQYQSLAQARAIENGLPVIVANQVGITSQASFFGASMIITADGSIVNQTVGMGNQYVIEEINLQERQLDFGVPVHEKRKDTYTANFLGEMTSYCVKQEEE